jgi:hypothetical protein
VSTTAGSASGARPTNASTWRTRTCSVGPQGLVHHVCAFPQLKEQMAIWVVGMDSPDRMDAAVHALTEPADPNQLADASSSLADNRLEGRR